MTSTPQLEHDTLEDFLHGHERARASRVADACARSATRHHAAASASARALNLFPTSLGERDEAGESRAQRALPGALPVAADRRRRQQQTVRAYDAAKTSSDHLHHAYVVVWQQNVIGGYYDFEGTDWLNPPLFAHARTQKIGGRALPASSTTARTSTSIGWRSGRVLYWVTNTLLEELSNAQMLAIARSAQPLH